MTFFIYSFFLIFHYNIPKIIAKSITWFLRLNSFFNLDLFFKKTYFSTCIVCVGNAKSIFSFSNSFFIVMFILSFISRYLK
jgi:hypothetical protein